MLFNSVTDLPAYVKRKPDKEQLRWMGIWNKTFRDTASEADAYKTANGALNLSREDVNMEPITCFVSCVFPDWEASGKYQVQLMRTGLWKDHPSYGDILIENADLADGVRNYRNSSLKPFLDYGHAITKKDPNIRPADRVACGWMADMWIETLDGTRLEPDEAEKSEERVLVLKGIYEVNEEANVKFQKKEFALFSPTWYPIYQNEETGELQGMTVIGGAATNTPHFNGMQGFVAIANSREEARAMSEMLPKASLTVNAPETMSVVDAVGALDGLGFKVDSMDYGTYRIRTVDSGDMTATMKGLEDSGFTVTCFYQGWVENESVIEKAETAPAKKAAKKRDAKSSKATATKGATDDGTTQQAEAEAEVQKPSGKFEIECGRALDRPQVERVLAPLN